MTAEYTRRKGLFCDSLLYFALLLHTPFSPRWCTDDNGVCLRWSGGSTSDVDTYSCLNIKKVYPFAEKTKVK